MRAGLALLVLALFTAPARADDWFMHEFGELRAYHQDWLAVCADQGLGPCRAVQVPTEQGARFFGPRRLTVRVLAEDKYRVDIYVRDLPAKRGQTFFIDVDGDVKPLPFWAWRPGEWKLTNVLETIAITDSDWNAQLVQDMKRGQRMALEWPSGGAVPERAEFSLRGISAAIFAIEQQLKRRTN